MSPCSVAALITNSSGMARGRNIPWNSFKEISWIDFSGWTGPLGNAGGTSRHWGFLRERT